MTIVPTPKIPPSTQVLINGQKSGEYDIIAGDYVTYIEDQLGVNMPKVNLRIIAEASFLQPNVLTLLVKGGSSISSVGQLKNKIVSVNASNDIGTLLIDSLLLEHGLIPRQVHYTNVPFPGVATALTTPKSPVSRSEGWRTIQLRGRPADQPPPRGPVRYRQRQPRPRMPGRGHRRLSPGGRAARRRASLPRPNRTTLGGA